jgi:hypothetical protein
MSPSECKSSHERTDDQQHAAFDAYDRTVAKTAENAL